MGHSIFLYFRRFKVLYMPTLYTINYPYSPQSCLTFKQSDWRLFGRCLATGLYLCLTDHGALIVAPCRRLCDHNQVRLNLYATHEFFPSGSKHNVTDWALNKLPGTMWQTGLVT